MGAGCAGCEKVVPSVAEGAGCADEEFGETHRGFVGGCRNGRESVRGTFK